MTKQRGADVQTVLYGPDGITALRVDYRVSPDNSEEPLFFVAPRSGEYLLEISAPSQQYPGATLRYELELFPIHQAEQSDRQRALGTMSFARGRRLKHQTELAEVAAKAFQAAAEHWIHAGESLQAAFAWEELSKQYVRLGEYDLSREAYQNALEIFLVRRPQRALVVAYDRGSTLKDESHEALAHFEEYYRLAQKLHQPAEVCDALRFQAHHLTRLGRTTEALEKYFEAREIWRNLGNEAAAIGISAKIGRLLTSTGDHERAIALMKEEQRAFDSDSPYWPRIDVLNAIGDAERRLGNFQDSLRTFNRSMELFELAERSSESLAETNRCLAHTTILLGLARGQSALKPDIAEDYFVQAIEALKKCDRVYERQKAVAIGSLGMHYLEQGHLENAMSLFEKALEINREENSKNGQASSYYARSRVFFESDRLHEAHSEIQRAITLVESIWEDKQPGPASSMFLSDKQRYYDLYVQILMRLGTELDDRYEERAFQVHESRRARMLRDSLHLDERLAIPPGFDKEFTELWEEMTRLELELDLGKSRLQERLHSAYLQYDLLQARMREERAELRVPQRNFRLVEIQKHLEPDAIVLEFALGEPHSFVWLVSAEEFLSFQLPPKSQLEALARRVYNGLVKPPTLDEIEMSRFRRDLKRLVQELFPRALVSKLRSQRLILVKDGALHLIPFAALPLPETHTGYHEGARFVDVHEIVNLPSVGALIEIRSLAEKVAATQGMLAFAGAVYRRPESTGPPSKALPGTAEESRFDGEPHLQTYSNLPASRQEGQEIIRLARQSGMEANSRLFLDFEATRSQAIENMEAYRYLHFALHGYENPVRPDHSGLLFSRFRENGDRQPSSLLTARDIQRLHLSADLVVLSACKSGLGQEARGEGFIGLTQAFLSAGARSLLVSLWDVPDVETSAFMQQFYRALFRPDSSPATALRDTQSWMMKQEGKQLPYFWAGFVLQGDWHPQRPQNNN